MKCLAQGHTVDNTKARVPSQVGLTPELVLFHCFHENTFSPRGLSGSSVSPDVLIGEVYCNKAPEVG